MKKVFGILMGFVFKSEDKLLSLTSDSCEEVVSGLQRGGPCTAEFSNAGWVG